MALTDFIIIRRSLRARMFSTVTTVLTVAVAVGLMLVLLSMHDSGRKAFERGSGNMHALVAPGGNSPLIAVLNGVFYAKPPRPPIPWSKYRQIAQDFPLEFAIPTQQGDSFRGEFPVVATTAEFFSAFKPHAEEPWRLRGGRYFTSSFEIVAGSAAAKANGLSVGDKLTLTHGIDVSRQRAAADHGAHEGHEHEGFAYTVVGILEPTGSAHDRALFTDLPSSWIIHAADRLEREASGMPVHAEDMTESDLTEGDKLITGIYIRVRGRGGDASAVMPQVLDALSRDPTITVAQPAQQIRSLFNIVSNIDQIFVGMAAVVMLSSGIAVMLALYNSMEQRRRQIAVLRVLGCTRARIFGLVITESAVIGLMGAAAGSVLAVAGSLAVAAVMRQRLGLVISPALEPRWALLVAFGTVALASLAGMAPAVRAYLTPVAANLKPIG